MNVVQRHWCLSMNPFLAGRAGFVATPGHVEAVARLVHAVEAVEPSARLEAPAGLGKSMVLDRALALVRNPSRRLARSTAPIDGPSLLADLAAGLGARLPTSASRATVWRALADAARLARLQSLAVVLAVDDDHLLEHDPDAARDLLRLTHVDPHPEARITLLRAGRPPEAPRAEPEPWALAIRLASLTRSETADYLAARLAEAGRDGPIFTPRALARLHALSLGVPRGLDRLAGLALMAGALRRLEIVGPDVIDGVAQECLRPAAPA